MRKQVVAVLFSLVLALGLTSQSLFARGTFDIVDGREDPLVIALQKYERKLWSPGAAEFVATINREGTCTLIQFVAENSNGKPDIQFDDNGNLITRDRYGKKLVELRRISAARLKQDLAIVLAGSARLEELNSETRKQLNVALYGPGYENGPRSEVDRARGAQRLKDAMVELGQYRDAKKVEKLQAKARQSSQSDTSSVRSSRQDDINRSDQRKIEADARQSTNAKETEGMAQRTLAAYNAFYTMPAPQGQRYSNVLISLQSAIRRLNLNGVDPDLISYFRLLDQKFTEEIPVLKAWEVDESKEDWAARERSARDAECKRARELGEDCERDAGDALTVWQDFLKFSGRASNANGTGQRKWGPIIQQLEAKYDPILAAPLKRLEFRYDYTFYSDIFDEKANAIFKLGVTFFEQEKYPEAAERFRAALRVNPNHLWAHFNLALSYERLGQYSLAISEYKESARLKVHYADTQAGVGYCYYMLGHYAEAVGPIREAIRLEPGVVNYHYYLGVSYLMIGNRSAALTEYRVLQRMDAKAAADLYQEINKRK